MELELKAVDRMNMLSTIMNTIAEGKTNIEAVNTRKLQDDIALILLTVDIHNLEHMQSLIQRLRQVDGVVSVRRATPRDQSQFPCGEWAGIVEEQAKEVFKDGNQEICFADDGC